MARAPIRPTTAPNELIISRRVRRSNALGLVHQYADSRGAEAALEDMPRAVHPELRVAGLLDRTYLPRHMRARISERHFEQER